jgi:hypothetical protein
VDLDTELQKHLLLLLLLLWWYVQQSWHALAAAGLKPETLPAFYSNRLGDFKGPNEATTRHVLQAVFRSATAGFSQQLWSLQGSDHLMMIKNNFKIMCVYITALQLSDSRTRSDAGTSF